MSVRDLLADLRAGRVPEAGTLAEFARGLADGRVTDAQAGAFAMGVCTGPGLGPAGRVALTDAMARGGDTLVWDLPGPILDKHSTGGVGDPVSLVLAPALAALGAFVPMISGRGLGHTGGTLDKLEAIPELGVDLSAAQMTEALRENGCAIVAASARIAPADRRLYAIRDVTSTVDQMDLICASILSKKLAAGLDALVLDVKAGSGAFMRDDAEAHALARTLCETATGAGLPTRALVTDMDQPLAPAIGNAVEVAAVMQVLDGSSRDSRLAQVAATLGGALLHLAGASRDADEGAARISDAIATGRALERFARMVGAQGGPNDFEAGWRDLLPAAPVIRDVSAPEAGYIAALDGTALGRAVGAMGGARARDGDRIDPSVGLDRIAVRGAWLDRGDPLCRLHAPDAAAADRARQAILAAITLSNTPPPERPLILGSAS